MPSRNPAAVSRAAVASSSKCNRGNDCALQIADQGNALRLIDRRDIRAGLDKMTAD